MEYDKDKVDEMMLALLWLSIYDEKYGSRAWKGYSWAHMERLHEKGFIGNPKNNNKSVAVSEEGRKQAEMLFKKHFGK